MEKGENNNFIIVKELMILKKYETKEMFLEENLQILLKEEAKNETIIGIILEHEDMKVNNWLLGRIEDREKVQAIFVVDDDKNGLLVYFPNKKEVTSEIISFLIDNIIDLNINFEEIVIEREYLDIISTLYSNKVNKEEVKIHYTDTLKLEKLKESYDLDLGDKLIKLEEEVSDPSKLISVVKEIYSDIYNREDCTDEEALKIANIYLKKGTYILTDEKEEKIYTQVVNVRKQINGSTIGAVITPKEFRGKGYAKKCLYAVCSELLKKNKFIVLHVNIQNSSAISVYEKIGFEKIDELVTIKFKINNY
ncbi:MAG TPA: GNAT family N-acetyltransferase [Candidatus Scatovivens faecipullorum]|nr:GNAT family N-acetyltransferase [Candidatus Scatovivens faecipullorum]